MVGRVIDSLIVFRFLKMLVTPFKKTPAFKFGFIDERGNRIKFLTDPDNKNQKLPNNPVTKDEKNSLTPLHRLVFNLKKLIEKIPGGKSILASYAVALLLLKEEHDLDDEQAEKLTMEQEEQEDQAGSGDEVAAAKEKGMKSDVQRVAKFMFNHKQLGPALEKLKGDNVEVAQLLALLSQEMGVDPADLGTLVTKVKGAMKEAEGDVFEVGDKVAVEDRNGQTGTVTEPMAGAAVIKLDDGEIVKV